MDVPCNVQVEIIFFELGILDPAGHAFFLKGVLLLFLVELVNLVGLPGGHGVLSSAFGVDFLRIDKQHRRFCFD